MSTQAHKLVRNFEWQVFFAMTCEHLVCTECNLSVIRNPSMTTEVWVQEQKRFIRQHPDPDACDACKGTGRVFNVPPKPGPSMTASIGWNRCHVCFGEGAHGCQACGYFGVRWKDIGSVELHLRISSSEGSTRTTWLAKCPRCSTVRVQAET